MMNSLSSLEFTCVFIVASLQHLPNLKLAIRNPLKDGPVQLWGTTLRKSSQNKTALSESPTLRFQLEASLSIGDYVCCSFQWLERHSFPQCFPFLADWIERKCQASVGEAAASGQSREAQQRRAGSGGEEREEEK